MAKRDYYDILGSKRGASDEELKKAFRQKAKESHPDRNPDDPSAEGRFKELNEAYDVLRDKDKKAAYDRYGHAAFEGGNGASAGGFHRGGAQGGPDFASAFSDVFEDLFGGFSGGGGAARNSQRATRGADLRYNLQVSLEDAYKGKQASLNLPGSVACETCNATGAEGGVEPSTCPTCSGMGKVRAQQGFFTVERTCPTCSGRGQVIKNPCKTCGGAGRIQKDRKLNVNIPAGVETGTRIRLAGEGEAGLRGGTPGDLYIFIEVAPHPIFEREAQNLFCRIPISMATATLGGELEAPTPDGGRSRVKVPAGVQTGKQLRLRGKGMPALRGAGHGDLYIELAVETPTNLSAKQKELMAEFEKQGKNNSPQTQDFFSKVKKFWDGVTG